MNRELTISKEKTITILPEITATSMEYIEQAKSQKTIKAYRTDFKHFVEWCNTYGLNSLPATPQTVANYLAELAAAGMKVSTLTRRVSSISQAHQSVNVESPTYSMIVRSVMAGIRRKKGTAQIGKTPILISDVRLMLDTLPENLLGIRDRALLLLGFAGAYRRSELVSLDFEDITFSRNGLRVLLKKSKTDQEGQGIEKGIAYGSHLETCPVRALEHWLEVSGIQAGPLFRNINRHGQIQPRRLSDKAVALIVKRRAAAAGLDPNLYAGHSLRSGLATSAAEAGVNERAIMKQTGHRSEKMVRKYIRIGNLFHENASAMIGL